MTALYDITIHLASLKNVPPNGFDVAFDNAEAAFKGQPTFVDFTEAWHRATREGIRAAMPQNYRLYAPVGNSAAFAFDTEQVHYDRGERDNILRGSLWLHGFVFAGRPSRRTLISDPRRMPWGQFIVNGSGGRAIRHGAVHVAPKGSRFGEVGINAGRRARDAATVRIERWLERSGHPALIGGDFNDISPGLGDGSVGVGIDRVVRQHGDFARFGAAVVTTYKLAHSDHPGVRVTVPVLGGVR